MQLLNTDRSPFRYRLGLMSGLACFFCDLARTSLLIYGTGFRTLYPGFTEDPKAGAASSLDLTAKMMINDVLGI